MARSKLVEPTHAELLDLLHEQSAEARIVTIRPLVRAADEEFGPSSYQAANARFGLATALSLGGRHEEAQTWALEALPIYTALLEADPENSRYSAEECFVRGMCGL